MYQVYQEQENAVANLEEINKVVTLKKTTINIIG